MKLPAWVRRLFKRESRAGAVWRVSLDGTSLSVTDQTGATRSVALSNIHTILIETNDQGPWVDDVWWMFINSQGRLEVAFPQGASGDRAVLDWVMSLEGAALDQIVAAQGSTGNAMFVIWRRPAANG